MSEKVVPLRPAKRTRPPDNGRLPIIRVVNGELPTIATQGEAALITSDMQIYQRGRLLVRPIHSEVPASRGRTTLAAGLATMNHAAMVDRLTRAARWERYEGRKKEWVSIDAPEKVAATILSRVGEWEFQSIAGVITTPTLRPDGSLLTKAGYDEETRLYHVQDQLLDIRGCVPANPTRQHAEEALADLTNLLKNFPTVTEVDKSVALSALMTPVVRGAISVAPMHALRASTAGTGKTFLVDVASAIATARPCPVATVAKSEEETEKRLAGLLLAAFPLICLDNVNGELGGDLLCQAIERPVIQVRPLGTSDVIEIESRATIFATGNVLRVRGDMTRRSLVCNLDAGVERPELRTFDFNPVETVLNDRARYVGAVLTIVLAHVQAGFPGQCTPLASFEDWSKYVRSALIWLGCADPCISMEDAREDDPELGELRELIEAWKQEMMPDASFTVAEIIAMIGEKFPSNEYEDGPAVFKFPRMREFITRTVSGRTGVDSKRLGSLFRSKEGRISDGYCIKKAGTAGGGLVRWTLKKRVG